MLGCEFTIVIAFLNSTKMEEVLVVTVRVCPSYNELTVDDSESLGCIDRVYSDSGERSTKVGDDREG